MRESDQRLWVGAVTTIGWFAEDSAACLRTVWPERHKSPNLHSCLDQKSQTQKLILLPPIPPEAVQEALSKLYQKLEDPETSLRTVGAWDVDTDIEIAEGTEKWINERMGSLTKDVTPTKEIWRRYVTRVRSLNDMLFFCQRKEIKKWYPAYDPTAIGQVSDDDRPWDLDHIIPTYYTGRYSLPKILRPWPSSIGNIRLWPMEINRGDGNAPPRDKLNNPPPSGKDDQYGIATKEDVLKASFMDQETSQEWISAVPFGADKLYLASDDPKYTQAKVDLIHCISDRWFRIYTEWYNVLNIRDLIESPAEQHEFGTAGPNATIEAEAFGTSP